MRQQTYSPDLGDPTTSATNAGGRLSPAQERTIHAWVRRETLPNYLGLGFVCLLFFLLLRHAMIVKAIFRSDPFGAKPMLFGRALPVSYLALMAGAILLAWFLVGLGSLRQILYTRHALLAGTIRQADGVIIWHGNEHLALLSGGPTQLPTWTLDRTVALSPGAYHFFFLPFQYSGWISSDRVEGGWLLSAAPQSAASTGADFAGAPSAASPSPFLQTLAAANGFHADALDANRAGRLTEAQTRTLARTFRHRRGQWVLIGLFFLLGSAGAFSTQGVTWRNGWALVFAAAGALFVLSAIWPGPRASNRDLADSRVVTLEGWVRRIVVIADTSGGGGQTQGPPHDLYYYQIANQRFAVAGVAAYDALDERLPYRLYYLPRTRQLVNLEPIAPPWTQPPAAPTMWSDGHTTPAFPGVPVAPITAAEVSAALGELMQAADPPSGGASTLPGMVVNHFQNATGTAQVMVGMLVGWQENRFFRLFQEGIARRGQPISGLGDDAYFAQNLLLAQKGNVSVTVLVVNQAWGADGARSLATSRQIAAAMVNRLA
ncbi:MAG: hypothetical protein ACR2M3_14120 [Thermomicrobiales bacterium]